MKLHPIFDDCCHKGEPSRYAIDRPFRDGEYVCATDGRIVVRLHDPANEYPSDAKGPPVGSLPWSEKHGPPMRMPPLPEAVVEPCPKCKGTRKVECGRCDEGKIKCSECGNIYRCPDCVGGEFPCEKCKDGTITRDGFRAVRIGLVCIAPGYARLLARHGAVVHPPTMGGRSPVYFNVGEIEGLVMPYKVDNPLDPDILEAVAV